MFAIFWLVCLAAAALTAPSVLINRRARPAAAASWLFALFALPPLGLAAWWLVGRTHLERRQRRRRRASRKIEAALSETKRRTGEAGEGAGARSRLAPSPPISLRDSDFPPTGGNCVAFLPDTEAVHESWRRLIANANDHLHVFFFAWHDDRTGRRMRKLLEERAQAGVVVRVLYDAVGCKELPRGFFDPLRAKGAQIAEFMPIHLLTATPMLNFRNHRKLLIADGRRAYTGGINVTDEYLSWQDIGVEVEGPAVHALQEVFVDDWHFATEEELTDERFFPGLAGGGSDDSPDTAVCEVIASGPDQTFNATREMLFLAITRTQQRLWIATPYFIPDEPLLMALRAAVYRGVDVRLFVPGQSNKFLVRRASRAYYGELIDGGVPIFEYQGMLHAKAVLFDDDNALIGSANLDTRSFRLNFELSMLIQSRPLNEALSRWFDRIGEGSVKVDREGLSRGSYFGRLGDALAHLLSPLL